ncbi:hypothetical protein MPER_00940, partial [Moniliophthora perniciosa FA553]
MGRFTSVMALRRDIVCAKLRGTIGEEYPQCSTSPNTLSDPSFHVAVHASHNEGELGYGSAVRVTHGMALWVAALIHVVSVEAYLRYSDGANYERHPFALEPRDYDTKDEF